MANASAATGIHAEMTESSSLRGLALTNASVAAGPVGVGAEAASANLSVDLVSYTRNKGLYAGVSIEGAAVVARDEWNRSYYGKAVTPADILIQREVSNPDSAELIAAIARVGNRSASVHGAAAQAK